LSARLDPRFTPRDTTRNAMHWIAVLRSASSLEAYHKTFAAPVTPDLAIAFLMLDQDLPRSLLYCVESIVQSLGFISGQAGRRFSSEAGRLAGQLASTLHYLRFEDLDLLVFLEAAQQSLYHISDSITQTYFAYEVA
jgi:uncharacterized alpha-E superfamily protein